MAEDAISKTLRDILEDFGKQLVQDTKQSIKDHGHESTSGQSGLIGSVRFLVRRRGEELTFTLDMDEHWEYIDKGTKGAKRKLSITEREQKILSLMDWITGKGINPKTWYRKKLKNPQNTRATFNDMHRSLANAISHNIARKGIIKRYGYKGSKFFTSLVEDGRISRLAEDISELLGQTIEIELTKELTGKI